MGFWDGFLGVWKLLIEAIEFVIGFIWFVISSPEVGFAMGVVSMFAVVILLGVLYYWLTDWRRRRG